MRFVAGVVQQARRQREVCPFIGEERQNGERASKLFVFLMRISYLFATFAL